ncbi:MAG: anhydro-N-acetylmuramic acid kinase [Pseudomonadota bacterium]|jgi:anhydro-N-acetylmuramic acid kinase
MSGTSLDGVDAALTEFKQAPGQALESKVIKTYTLPFSAELREELLSLHEIGHNEIHRTALAGNQLARLYAQAVNGLLAEANIGPTQISAIGCHGQTIRHRPELGYTIQIGNAALLAELTGITIVSDFRSRDIAANGQGAPLVPAFHQAVFGHPNINRTIINIGGIANLSVLNNGQEIIGFDSGPGNMLMDAWAEMHTGQRYDEAGNWAMTGKVIDPLLSALLAHEFFTLPPPKSTGRDLFNIEWLKAHLKPHDLPQNVQRTLLAFTAKSIADAVQKHAPNTDEIYLCGGGAFNQALIQHLRLLLHPVKIEATDILGINVSAVEAAAFAWLARQALLKAPGNLPCVTGADGLRILGAIYAC